MTIKGTMKKRSLEKMLKPNMKNEANRLRATSITIAKLQADCKLGNAMQNFQANNFHKFR